MSDLVTTAELATALRRSVKTIRRWKQEGTITASVDTGHMLFDPEKVKKQLAAKAKSRAKESSVVLAPGMVPTL